MTYEKQIEKFIKDSGWKLEAVLDHAEKSELEDLTTRDLVEYDIAFGDQLTYEEIMEELLIADEFAEMVESDPDWANYTSEKYFSAYCELFDRCLI